MYINKFYFVHVFYIIYVHVCMFFNIKDDGTVGKVMIGKKSFYVYQTNKFIYKVNVFTCTSNFIIN